MLGRFHSGALALAASALTLPSGAIAAEIAFNGTRDNTDAPFSEPPGPQRCGGGLFTVNIGNGPMSSATGTSNFGNYSATQSHCINPAAASPNPFSDGKFTYVFEGGSLSGDYFGVLTAVEGQPGLFDTVETYIVTRGTDRFSGATGSFVGRGQVDFRGAGPVAFVTFTAVPEPTTWAMMIAGFGLVGGAMRRRGALKLAFT